VLTTKNTVRISSKCNWFAPLYGWKIAHLVLKNKHQTKIQVLNVLF